LNKCDYILMMKDGRIFQEGTHEELMEDKTGEYYRLASSVCKSPDNDEDPETGKSSFQVLLSFVK